MRIHTQTLHLSLSLYIYIYIRDDSIRIHTQTISLSFSLSLFLTLFIYDTLEMIACGFIHRLSPSLSLSLSLSPSLYIFIYMYEIIACGLTQRPAGARSKTSCQRVQQAGTAAYVSIRQHTCRERAEKACFRVGAR